MKNIPDTIYLQVGEDVDPEDDFYEYDRGVTWCDEQVFDTDAPYIYANSDNLKRLQASQASMLEHLEERDEPGLRIMLRQQIKHLNEALRKTKKEATV